MSRRFSKVAELGALVLLAGGLSILWSPAVASAATLTFNVTTTADTHDATPGDGVCSDSTGQCSIRAAIEETDADAVGSNVTVSVPAGKYALTLGAMTLTRNTFTLNGSGQVLIKGGGKQVLVVQTAGVAVLSTLTITGANGKTASGGAISNSGQTTLNHVTLSNNVAKSGGALNNAAKATLILVNSTVKGNQATAGAFSRQGGSGGGILNAGTLNLTGTTVSGNFAGTGGQGENDPAGQGGNGGGISNSATVTIQTSTITGNFAGSGGLGIAGNEPSGSGGNGGGIYSSSGSVTVANSTISSNVSGTSGPASEAGNGSAGDGGGIWSAGTLSVTGAIFTQNSGGTAAVKGGNGGAVLTRGNATIQSSTFSQNTGGSGGGGGGNGGAISNSGTLSLSNTTLSSNTAGAGEGGTVGGNGGGLYNSGGSATLSSDTLNANASGRGGDAIFVDPGCLQPGAGGNGGAVYSSASLSLTDSTVSGNSVGIGGFYQNPCAGEAPNGVGAGLATAGGTATVSYATIADNTDGIDALGGTTTLGGTIVADNTLDNCAGTIAETSGYNLDSGTSCGFVASTDLTGTEPALGPLGANGGPTSTQALLAGSPAIDHGGTTALGCPALDQRGDPRPDETADGGACDIGAYESQGLG
jgi:hypothetical protein